MNLKNIIVGFGVILLATGGIKTVDAIHDYYSQFPEDIIKIQSSVSLENAGSYEYPKKVKVHYHLPVGSPLVSEDAVYAFTGSDEDFWKISVLDETKDGYIVEAGEEEYENFLIEEPKDFGFKGVMKPEKLNGTFEMTFYSEGGMTSFFEELEENKEWKDVFVHMKERGELK